MRYINVLLTYFLLVRCLKVMLLVIREHQPLKVVIRQGGFSALKMSLKTGV